MSDDIVLDDEVDVGDGTQEMYMSPVQLPVYWTLFLGDQFSIKIGGFRPNWFRRMMFTALLGVRWERNVVD